MNKFLDIFSLPFHYDPEGQFILDDKNSIVLDVRGWGQFQKKKDGVRLQDDFGKMVAQILNERMAGDDNSNDKKIQKDN